METTMNKCFNAYASKIMNNETLKAIVTDLYYCYYKYNGYKYAENYQEIVDALSFENKEALADRITRDWDLDEETQTELLYDITASELVTEKGWN